MSLLSEVAAPLPSADAPPAPKTVTFATLGETPGETLSTSVASNATKSIRFAKLSPKMKALALAALIVIVLIIAYCVVAPRLLSRRLSARGWVLYSKAGCHYCEQQLKILGGSYAKTVTIDSAGTVTQNYRGAPPVDIKTVSVFPYWYRAADSSSAALEKKGLQEKSELKAMLA